MPVLERSELEASPLADLHAIADQVGVESFKRLRKAELIDAILAGQGGGSESAPPSGETAAEGEEAPKSTRRRRLIRPRRGAKRQEPGEAEAEPGDEHHGELRDEEPPAPDAGAERALLRRALLRGALRRRARQALRGPGGDA